MVAETPLVSVALRRRATAWRDHPRIPFLADLFEHLYRIVRRTWVLVVFLTVWEVKTRVDPSLFMPPITEIFARSWETWFTSDPTRGFLSDAFWTDAGTSLSRMIRGYLAAMVIGCTAGLVLGIWRSGSAFFAPLIRFGMSTPSSVLLPVAVALFGIESSMNVFLIAIGSTWAVLINTVDGVKSIDQTMILTARSLHLSRFAYFRRVILPGASPQIFAGLRVALGISLILMVVSELFAATEGLGYFIVRAQRTFQFTDMWSGVFLLALLGLIFNGIFGMVEMRILRWHRGVARESGVKE